MSSFAIKNEINKLITESGLKKDPKMVCSITRIFKMRYPHIDSLKVCKIANEVLR